MQEVEQRVEKSMEDWPREDLSTELPLDKRFHAEIKRICDEIQRSTEREVRRSSWPSAEIPLRSVSYILSDSNRHVEASFCGSSDTKILNPEVVWEDLEFEIRDGRLKFRPESGRQVSPFADVMIPILRRQTQSILESATYVSPISWPVSDKAHETISTQANRLLDLYLKALKDYLERSDNVIGHIEDIEYVFWFQEGYAKIRVSLDIKGTPDRFLNPGVELDYKAGKFRLKDLISPAWSGGVEYVADASNSATDHALEKWVKDFALNDMFEDARVGPPFEWTEVAKDLPEGMGQIVRMRQRCHPFLGEYHRKYRIELSDGRVKTFRLPTDSGSVMKTDVFLIQAKGKQFIRLKDHHFTDMDFTDVVIALDSLKIRSPRGLSQGNLLFTFAE
jgi:hypothetical protein